MNAEVVAIRHVHFEDLGSFEQVLGERGLVEVIGLCGYYTLVSMTLNTFEFDLPDGQVSELT